MGLIENRPNSRNVVPGEVFFTVDFRHADPAVIDVMENLLGEAISKVRGGLGLEIAIKKIMNQPPVRFDDDCIAAVREANLLGIPR